MGIKRILRKAVKLGLALACFISFSAAAATISYPLSFSTGWNLAGNSLTTPIDVKTVFGAQTNIQTVWKWDAVGSKWAFYAPSLDAAGTLSSYATSKGYSVLATINPGEGFWVNALAPISLGTQNGTGFSLASANLATSWNLVATGDDLAPVTFTTNVGNVTTLWAWDSANSAWYFYAPSLAANSTLSSYITSKGYKDFGTLTLGKGLGFWVNYAGVTAGTSYSITGSVSGAAGVTVNLSGTVTASTTTDANGNYIFSGLPNAAYTVTPALSGYSFAPTSLSVSVSGASVTGNNFVATLAGCPSVVGVRSTSINPGAGPTAIGASSPDGLYSLWGGTLNATPSTYTVTGSSATTPNTFLIASVGPVCGVGGITSIPTTGYQSSLTLQQGYGYVGQMGNGTYIRFYVTSTQVGPVINIQYEYPATICPTSDHAVFGVSSYTVNGVIASGASGATATYAFVGCNGTAIVQAWGAGGAGGDPSLSFYGGNGGGGGGGGGYGTQDISMVPGQWYVVSVGVGGDINWNATPNASFGIGGTSSIAVEAGNTISSATGGQPGTDGGSGTTFGTGGAPGSSNATIRASGAQGSDGQSNFNKTLCGGAGSMGPGGAGGAGGGSGGTGGSGGCTPGTPSTPGGGGSGGSQYGQPTPGAGGQVIIDW
ncbi:MAG: SdrD B-like domain-containing protein [Sulfuricella sp.]